MGGPSHGARVWCLGRVPKHRNQWQEVEGLLFSPKNSQLVHILSFHSQGVVSLFIFPTGPTALDSEPRGRRYAKITGHDRNRLYSRAIHCPASMEMHYVQLFLLKSVYEITDCAKNQIPCHGPPRLKEAKSNFFTNRNILQTLKNEPLNIMLLHNTRRMDGP